MERNKGVKWKSSVVTRRYVIIRSALSAWRSLFWQLFLGSPYQLIKITTDRRCEYLQSVALNFELICISDIYISSILRGMQDREMLWFLR